MILLAIDPGETTGLVLLKYEHRPIVIDDTQWKLPIDEVAIKLDHVLRTSPVAAVVLEDYRIYQGKANLHIGNRLYTAELIGAIRAVCALCTLRGVEVYTLPASKKGRWPDARLRARFPGHGVEGVHALDALKLGLAHIEKELGWQPQSEPGS